MMNRSSFARSLAVACALSLLACSSSNDGGGGATDSGSATDAPSGADTSTTDGGSGDVASEIATDAPPADVVSSDGDDGGPGVGLVRIFDADDGAAIYLCQDGARFGGEFDRITPGGSIDSGYMEVVAGPAGHSVHAQATTAVACTSASTSDPWYPISKGQAKTLFVKGITGFSGIVALEDDLAAPASGTARLRIFDGASAFTAAHGGWIVVCSGGSASQLGDAYHDTWEGVTPGTRTIEVRENVGGTSCAGALIVSFDVTLDADAAHSLFLVDGKGTGSNTHASFCTDARAGVAVTAPTCVDHAF